MPVEPVEPPTEISFWADPMIGRLAHYLRMLGCDVEPAPEMLLGGDPTRPGRRQLLTRSRERARATPGALLIRSVRIDEQLRELARARPELPRSIAFQRCTLCNGPLQPSAAPVHAGRAEWTCARCGHRYWAGSHTARVEAEVRRWLAGPGA